MTDDRRAERMQRVRIGLTGLSCVFLLVLLAAAFFGLTNREPSGGPLVVEPAGGGAGGNVVAESPREPLAELGVAPGFGGGEAIATNSTTPAPAPTPARSPGAPR